MQTDLKELQKGGFDYDKGTEFLGSRLLRKLTSDLLAATSRYDALSLDQKLERYRSALAISKHSEWTALRSEKTDLLILTRRYRSRLEGYLMATEFQFTDLAISSNLFRALNRHHFDGRLCDRSRRSPSG